MTNEMADGLNSPGMKFLVRVLIILILAFGLSLLFMDTSSPEFQQAKAEALGWIQEKVDQGFSKHPNVDQTAEVVEASTPSMVHDNETPPFSTSASSLDGNPGQKPALEEPRSPATREQDIAKLAANLAKGAQTDLEKARVIYDWLTENISYDDRGYNSGRYSPTDAESVLKNGVGVCDGYASLFAAIGLEMGLEIEKVSGYSKGYGYRSGQFLAEPDHAWNRINIDGQWKLFDATWGEGYGTTEGGKLKSVKEFDAFWFDTDPYAFVFTHYPEDGQTELSPSLSLAEFGRLPMVDKGLFQMGFDAKEIYRACITGKVREFPEAYSNAKGIQMIQAPQHRELKIGTSYQFEFDVPQGREMAVVPRRDQWEYFSREGSRFMLEFTPRFEGEVDLYCKFPKAKNFSGLLTYRAVK